MPPAIGTVPLGVDRIQQVPFPNGETAGGDPEPQEDEPSQDEDHHWGDDQGEGLRRGHRHGSL
jgi:hypothetical protein